jgi:hypothetical protein
MSRLHVKHWHKWRLRCFRDEDGKLIGDIQECEECEARKRVRTEGTRFIAEYARPGSDFEPIKTGSGPNIQILKARADGRRYDAIALLAWRQYECDPYGPSVIKRAEALGWNLPARLLMEKRPITVEPIEDDGRIILIK